MPKQIPSLGDSVIFIPDETDEQCLSNRATANPATVVREWGGNTVNLMVFPDCYEPVSRTSVVHKSEATAAPYWQWPWEYRKEN